MAERLTADPNADALPADNATSLLPVGLQAEILGNVFAAILTATALYVVVCLLLYEWKTRRLKKWTLSKLHIASAASALMSCLAEQFELRLGKAADVWCLLYTIMVASFYLVGSLCTYTLLWWRQRTFYTDPLLRSCNSKTMRVLSRLTIFGVYAAMMSAVLTITLSYELHSTPDGCLLSVKEGQSVIPTVCLTVLAACYVVFQLLLLALIVYPLKNSGGKLIICGEGRGARTNEILVLIKRLVICTAVCVASALLCATIIACSILFARDSYWSLIVHVDLIVNTVAIVCTTANWRQRLFPCYENRAEEEVFYSRDVTVHVSA